MIQWDASALSSNLQSSTIHLLEREINKFAAGGGREFFTNYRGYSVLFRRRLL